MSLTELTDAPRLRSGADVFAYLETLDEVGAGGQGAHPALLCRSIGTDEVTLAIFVGAMFDRSLARVTPISSPRVCRQAEFFFFFFFFGGLCPEHAVDLDP